MARSVTEMQRQLYQFVRESRCDLSVLQTLSENGKFTQHEDAIWDFKRETKIASDRKYTDPDFNANCCELIKDIVALHNTYGGYLILGISEDDRELLGISEGIDLDSLTS